MAGIYLHIPFCRQACHYCNFHFSVSQRNKEQIVDCLIMEMELRKGFFDACLTEAKGRAIQSIYLGGGTPSTLGINHLQKIFSALYRHFCVMEDAEITLEANPEDLTPGYLLMLRETPVNRLSIGIQSFHEPDLKYMNRSHSSKQAIQCIEQAQKAGYSNITIDLIYGTPTMDDKAFTQNLEMIVQMGIQHVSAYALTVEPYTALEVFIKRGKLQPVDEEQCARQFELLMDFLAEKGYLHYEISNFALPGMFSRHNLSYWIGAPYLGLGPSAHSYKQNKRSWNPANTTAYTQSITKGVLPLESEELSSAQQYDEYLMTSLRTMWGCSLERVESGWGIEKVYELRKQSEKYILQGLMLEIDHHFILTNKGRLFADRIASDLFWV
ncbi:MAG TPA: radical SAM family heme chaperone HemW [Bacteroidales bacterium]|nr:radical SAM family heme chaperone HemW [Bacteroidales bacterium]